MTVDSAGCVVFLYNDYGGLTFRAQRFSPEGGFDFNGILFGITIGTSGLGDGRAMKVGANRSIYVAGLYGLDERRKVTTFTVGKINVDGTVAWRSDYPSPFSGINEATALALDGTNYIYAAGSTTNSATGKDIVVIKYDDTGKQLWVDTYDGPAHGNDIATGLCVDASGNVYVTGHSATPQGGTEYVTIKYTPAPKIQRQPNGVMRVEFYTAPGQEYAIDASTDFLNWTSLITNTATATGLIQYDDTNAPTIPRRFYRGNSNP